MTSSGGKLRCGVLLALTITALGCNSGKRVATSEQAASRFHSQLDEEQFGAIYDSADDEFQKSDSRDGIVALMSKIHRSLGKVSRADRQTYFVNFNTSGTFVTLTYATSFANDPKADEQFVFRVDNENAKLVNYHVNSTVLMKQMTQ